VCYDIPVILVNVVYIDVPTNTLSIMGINLDIMNLEGKRISMEPKFCDI